MDKNTLKIHLFGLRLSVPDVLGDELLLLSSVTAASTSALAVPPLSGRRELIAHVRGQCQMGSV